MLSLCNLTKDNVMRYIIINTNMYEIERIIGILKISDSSANRDGNIFHNDVIETCLDLYKNTDAWYPHSVDIAYISLSEAQKALIVDYFK